METDQRWAFPLLSLPTPTPTLCISSSVEITKELSVKITHHNSRTYLHVIISRVRKHKKKVFFNLIWWGENVILCTFN